MFCGIVETTGIVKKIVQDGSNKHFTIEPSKDLDVYIDQSISHNGVCLTVINVDKILYVVTAVYETLIKTNLNQWQEGQCINLERSLLANTRIDGHFVQGHVDTTVVCDQIIKMAGSWYFYFNLLPEFKKYIVDKGSICINGVSLTVVEVKDALFSVAIIPYTYEHTNFKKLSIGDKVNIEYDILGKYIVNYMNSFSAGIGFNK